MTNKNRRSFIQKTGVLAVWSAPVLTAVTLPVHAQTSAGGLVDVTSPPPILSACQSSAANSVPQFSFLIRNSSQVPITVNALSMTDASNTVAWSLSTPTAVPFTFAVGQTITITMQSTPTYSCVNGTLQSVVVFQTDNGGYTFNIIGAYA